MGRMEGPTDERMNKRYYRDAMMHISTCSSSAYDLSEFEENEDKDHQSKEGDEGHD